MRYASSTPDRLEVSGTGTGGLAEFTEQLQDSEACFGYVRHIIGNDEMSRRSKFILVCWCGPNVNVMRRGRMTPHIGEVKNVLKAYAIEVQTDHKEDLQADHVEVKLKKAMGANCKFMRFLI